MYPGFGSFRGIGATRLSQLELNQPGTWLKQMGSCRAKTGLWVYFRFLALHLLPDANSFRKHNSFRSPKWEASGLASHGFAARRGIGAPLQMGWRLNRSESRNILEARWDDRSESQVTNRIGDRNYQKTNHFYDSLCHYVIMLFDVVRCQLCHFGYSLTLPSAGRFKIVPGVHGVRMSVFGTPGGAKCPVGHGVFFGTKQRSLNLAQIYNLLHNVKASFDILYVDYWEHVYGHWAMFGLKMIV